MLWHLICFELRAVDVYIHPHRENPAILLRSVRVERRFVFDYRWNWNAVQHSNERHRPKCAPRCARPAVGMAIQTVLRFRLTFLDLVGGRCRVEHDPRFRDFGVRARAIPKAMQALARDLYRRNLDPPLTDSDLDFPFPVLGKSLESQL